MSSGNTERHIQFMNDLNTTIICCTPSYTAYIVGRVNNTDAFNVNVEMNQKQFTDKDGDVLAMEALEQKNYFVKPIDVLGVKIDDQPGKLNEALEVLANADVNVEYLYAFMTHTEKHAYVVLRVEDNALAETTLENAGFHLISEVDISKL